MKQKSKKKRNGAKAQKRSSPNGKKHLSRTDEEAVLATAVMQPSLDVASPSASEEDEETSSAQEEKGGAGVTIGDAGASLTGSTEAVVDPVKDAPASEVASGSDAAPVINTSANDGASADKKTTVAAEVGEAASASEDATTTEGATTTEVLENRNVPPTEEELPEPQSTAEKSAPSPSAGAGNPPSPADAKTDAPSPSDESPARSAPATDSPVLGDGGEVLELRETVGEEKSVERKPVVAPAEQVEVDCSGVDGGAAEMDCSGVDGGAAEVDCSVLSAGGEDESERRAVVSGAAPGSVVRRVDSEIRVGGVGAAEEETAVADHVGNHVEQLSVEQTSPAVVGGSSQHEEDSTPQVVEDMVAAGPAVGRGEDAERGEDGSSVSGPPEKTADLRKVEECGIGNVCEVSPKHESEEVAVEVDGPPSLAEPLHETTPSSPSEVAPDAVCSVAPSTTAASNAGGESNIGASDPPVPPVMEAAECKLLGVAEEDYAPKEAEVEKSIATGSSSFGRTLQEDSVSTTEATAPVAPPTSIAEPPTTEVSPSPEPSSTVGAVPPITKPAGPRRVGLSKVSLARPGGSTPAPPATPGENPKNDREKGSKVRVGLAKPTKGVGLAKPAQRKASQDGGLGLTDSPTTTTATEKTEKMPSHTPSATPTSLPTKTLPKPILKKTESTNPTAPDEGSCSSGTCCSSASKEGAGEQHQCSSENKAPLSQSAIVPADEHEGEKFQKDECGGSGLWNGMGKPGQLVCCQDPSCPNNNILGRIPAKTGANKFEQEVKILAATAAEPDGSLKLPRSMSPPKELPPAKERTTPKRPDSLK